MKPYAVKLWWIEPDGKPNMLMASIEAATIFMAITAALQMLHHTHYIVDPCKIECELDVVKQRVG